MDKPVNCFFCKHWDHGCVFDMTPCRSFSKFKPKENKRKPQFTEEEARDFLIDSGVEPEAIELCMTDLGRNSRIRKSDLEILIEEAEEALAYYANTDRIDKITRGFRAMKAEIERLKK